MAELTFKSPGVSTREIDLSGPTALGPQGTPAGIIGTALKGRAFVPITVATYQDFVAEFGSTDGEKFGPLAMNEWMRNARAGTYVRVLGVGDGKKRDDTTGVVKNSGFVVGERLVKDSGLIGSTRDALKTMAGHNPFAVGPVNADSDADFADAADRPQPLGRMNWLGSLMVDANSSGLLADSGISDSASVAATVTLSTTDGDAIHGLTAGQKITLISTDGHMVDYFVSDTGDSGVANGAAVAQGATLKATGAVTASRTAGSHKGVAVGFDLSAALAGGTDQAEFLNSLKDAVEGATGHNGKITVGADLVAANGVQNMVFTQASTGQGGNTIVTENLATITISGNFTGGVGGAAKPILRAAVMTADGIVMALSSSYAPTAIDTTEPPVSDKLGTLEMTAGAPHGTVATANGKQAFEIFLNGHKATSLYPNKIKASFDPTDPSYLGKVLNTDPSKIREAGHYLYAHWDVHPALAIVSGSMVGEQGHEDGGSSLEEGAFVLVGAKGRNQGSATQPNYEDFQERFRTARSPWFISQDFGAGVKNLFKIHALDDGARANDLFKITIENIAASSNENNKFGKFDVVIRDFYDNDTDPVVLESYRGVNLDRSSENYIARRIGDQHAYYDFDQRAGAQKLRIDGTFSNRSRFVRVQLHSDVTRGVVPQTALPCGFRGPGHLSLDGNTMLQEGASDGQFVTGSGVELSEVREVMQVPVPFRKNVSQGKGNKKRSNADLCWGVQFERMDSVEEPNRNTVVDSSIASFTKFFPDHRKDIANVFVSDNAGAANLGNGAVLDSDTYNNNLFTLERIQVSTGSTDRPVVTRWDAATYRRSAPSLGTSYDLTLADGTVIDSDTTRYLDPAKDFTHLPTRKYLKFTTFVQQGFDGFNIFDKEKAKLSDVAARREFGETANQGGVQGPTIASFRKAIDVMEEKADVEIQILAIPGLRHPSITDYAVDSVENRFDAMLLMDIEEKDQNNEFVTGSSEQLTNVTYTVNNFESRNLDSSFAAAYFPDVVITDPATNSNVQCPPSVAVLGAFSLNDSVSHPWFAPAGFTRGALSTVLESQVKLKRANLDALYEADINPITSFPHTPGVVVFGQKTLQAAQSALDRVNVRRLLIDIRRRVKKIANGLLFEPNRVDTLARFSNLVNPVMQQIQTQQGLDRYKVQIDTSTTTQADVENNTIRGKIFLQPTRSLEFISLDFVVTNQGAEI